MEDFPKKLMVLVLLLAFFGALFLEAPLIYKKVQDGGIPSLNFLNLSNIGKTQNNSYKAYNSGNQSFKPSKRKDGSYSSPIYVPTLDPAPFTDINSYRSH